MVRGGFHFCRRYFILFFAYRHFLYVTNPITSFQQTLLSITHWSFTRSRPGHLLDPNNLFPGPRVAPIHLYDIFSNKQFPVSSNFGWNFVYNGRSIENVVEMNEEDDGDVASDDVEVLWDTLSNGFKRAQVVLDQNRELIQRVNENHMSRIPDNVATNVGLINQINGNINIFRVTKIYSDLSVNFARSFNRRTVAKNDVRRSPSCSS